MTLKLREAAAGDSLELFVETMVVAAQYRFSYDEVAQVGETVMFNLENAGDGITEVFVLNINKRLILSVQRTWYLVGKKVHPYVVKRHLYKRLCISSIAIRRLICPVFYFASSICKYVDVALYSILPMPMHLLDLSK